jgi:predicted RNase H-like HicB family nuclease
MRSVKRKYPAIVWREEDLFVASVLGLELTSQGRTRKEALTNLQEALDLLLEEDQRLTVPMTYDEVKLFSVYA